MTTARDQRHPAGPQPWLGLKAAVEPAITAISTAYTAAVLEGSRQIRRRRAGALNKVGDEHGIKLADNK